MAIRANWHSSHSQAGSLQRLLQPTSRTGLRDRTLILIGPDPNQMTCHHGHTLQHAIFGLLHLTTPFGLAGWHHAPLNVPTACFVAGAIYHAGMAVVCESASVSDAVHCYWETDAFVRLRMAHMTCSLAASLVWLASSSIMRGKDIYKAATNEAMTLGLIGLVLANICSLCWAFSTAGSVEHILPAYGVTSVLAFCSRWCPFSPRTQPLQ